MYSAVCPLLHGEASAWSGSLVGDPQRIRAFGLEVACTNRLDVVKVTEYHDKGVLILTAMVHDKS